MKKSIRVRFTALLFITISALILVICILNTFGLEVYYRNEKVKEIRKAYESIDSVVLEASENGENPTAEESVSSKLGTILREYSNKYNITIALIDSATNKALFSSERDGEALLKRAQDALFGSDNEESIKSIYSDENYRIISHYIKNLDTSFIECIGYCSDNQTLVVMSTPIASLKESVELSNRFLIYIGMLAFAICLTVVFFMTKRITRPILALAEISERMGKLDFDAKYTGDNLDEVGILGSNMNAMSDKLRETIEELKSANERLKEDIRKKEEIDVMRKDFIANVSHELKTPIALIQGYAEGLNEGLCDDAENRSYYTEVIIDEADKMNRMVKQLLTLSALESGAQEMNMETFSMSELITAVIASTRILLADKEAEIVYLPEKDYICYGDEFKLEEVVTNYISNAINHVSENGRIEISIEENADKIRVRVFNTGNLIPDEDIENIWDKFYKVDKAHSRGYGGSGVGLSIVRAIMEAHSNKFGVYNREDGVEFWFEADRIIFQRGEHD